eukprot:s1918_g7.t1
MVNIEPKGLAECVFPSLQSLLVLNIVLSLQVQRAVPMIDYERKHAEKRLLRARNARKKWTQTMQRFAKGDRNAQQEISKQAQKAHDEEQALRRAIQGKEARDSDSEAVDLSDEDGDEAQTATQSTVKKAKRLTVQEIRDLDAQGELPSSGLLGMKFMQEAIKQKREDAKKEALDVLKE